MFREVATILFAGTLAGAVHAGPLNEAAAEGDLARVQELLANGEKVNRKDPLVGSALHSAAMAGQTEVARVLIEAGARVDAKGGILNLTPLQVAVTASGDMTAFLIAEGADFGVRDIDGNTLLHLAADAGIPKVIRTLLSAGLDPAARNGRNLEPAEIAGAAGHFEVVDLLKENGALVAAKIDPVSGLLAAADAGRGEELFMSTGCSHCHDVAPGGDTVGPNLRGIVGMDKASSGTFEFSEALTRVGGSWTYEDLNRWLADPGRFAPGNLMNRAPQPIPGAVGLPDAQERADIIAYLRLQSDVPVPLPE